MGILLEKGERGLLIGKTGSGKTGNALWQIRNSDVWPVFILDTKIENAFFGLPQDDEILEVVDSVDGLLEIAKRRMDEWPDYVIIRPRARELLDMDALDQYTLALYDHFGSCFIYFDEAYNWHSNGRPGVGLVALLTRGRSRGKTVLLGSQRPVLISQFCKSESNKFYVHHISLAVDRKSIEGFIPDYAQLPKLPKHHFYHYEEGFHDTPQLYLPVPFKELKASEITYRKKRWL